MNNFQSLVVGVFVGGFVAICAVVYSVSPLLQENRDKLTDCQKDLPRSQNCVLIAVPKLVLEASEESKER